MAITSAAARAPLTLPAARLRQLALVGLWSLWAAGALWLATYNLELYPTTWFDEGSHLHVPKTLVQEGVYADRSAEGYRYFGPTASVGPTVLLPIALAFKVVGIGLVQARAVMAAYLLAAVALLALLAQRRYCATTALFASLLLVTAPGVNLLYLGRQVLGEVPAFAFLVVGLLWWPDDLERGRRPGRRLVGASLAFGLAALTKGQFGLILAPSLAAMALLDRFYYRRASLRAYVLPLGVVVGAVAAGVAVQFLPLLGTPEAARSLALWRDASAGAIFVFSPQRTLSALKFLVSSSVFAFWGLPALLYGALLARERTAAGRQHALLVLFATAGLAWFAFGSIGWPRYAFPALAVSTLLVAKLFRDLSQSAFRLGEHAGRFGQRSAQWLDPAGIRAAAVVLAFTLITGSTLAEQVRAIATASERSAQETAAYLQTHVPPAAVVETWEPELGFLSDHRFHYPPSGWLDRAVRARWLQPSGAAPVYDPLQVAHPAYLVVGPFGKYSGMYQSILASGRVDRLTTIGAYDLYRVR